jgi:hypothetical protein
MTWVISDYVAAQGSSELSVQKGQQVEVIDTNCLGAPDYCLVRLTNATTNNNNLSTTSLSSSSTQEQIVQEGLVPSSILKPPPTQMKNRRTGDGDEGELLPNCAAERGSERRAIEYNKYLDALFSSSVNILSHSPENKKRRKREIL